MNLAHLRKQAKNFKSIYPELDAAHGTGISLSAAQETIARTHGFPSWTAAVNKSAADGTAAAKPPKTVSVDVAQLIRDGYEFDAEAETSLAVALDDNGEPTHYSKGREVILRIRRRRDQAQVDREDDAMDALEDRISGNSGGYDVYTPVPAHDAGSRARGG